MSKHNMREYREEDWSQILELILNAENFGENFVVYEKRRIDVFRKSPDYGKIFVSENLENNKIIGFIVIEIKWRSISIETLITHHEHLRKGNGRLLIEYVKEFGEKHPDVNVIIVDTGDFMKYAQQFYLSCGFQTSGYVAHSMSWFNHQVYFALPLKGNK